MLSIAHTILSLYKIFQSKSFEIKKNKPQEAAWFSRG